MKKNKVTYEAAIKQMDLLMPDEIREQYKGSLTTCKDSTDGIKDNCEAAQTLLKCLMKINADMKFP